MAYKITKDFITNNTGYINKGRYRKRYDNGNVIDTLPDSSMPIEFRLLDDDNTVYLQGISNNDSSFTPLDDYMNDLGVTSIEYFINGNWEQL